MRVQVPCWPATLVSVTICSLITLSAHVTPPRVLMTEREALERLFPGAGQAQPQQLRLMQEVRRQIHQQFGWKAEPKYRVFPVGDASGSAGALFVLVDYTLHGPVRTAVAIDEQGRVKGAHVLEVQEEPYVWIKPVIDEDFAKPFVGRDCPATSKAAASAGPTGGRMTQFYRSVLVNQLCHAAVLHRLVMRGGDSVTK